MISKQIAREIRTPLGIRLDAEGLDTATVTLRLGRLRARLLRFLGGSRIRRLVGRTIAEIEEANSGALSELITVGMSPSIEGVMGQWIRQNIELITSIATTQLDQVQEVVTEAATSGMRVETLQKRILERFSVSRSRAELIARDQVLKANANLTQTRHREAGIIQYVWSTSRDERVRDRHTDLEGRTFFWADPPVTNDAGDMNHPGEDYQCRCVAIPVIPDVLPSQ